MHHQGNRLHLDGGRRAQASFLEILKDSWVQAVLCLQFLKCAHRFRDVRAVHVYAILIANAVDLKLIVKKNKQKNGE